MDPYLLLFNAAESGDIVEFKRVLEDNPGLDINWKNSERNGWTFLHIAALEGHHEIVKIILAHPRVNIYALSGGGMTACVMPVNKGALKLFTFSVKILVWM